MANDLDFDNRQLCPDGACIGVIGANGRCKVCGKRGEGPVTASAAAAAAEAGDGEDLDAAAGDLGADDDETGEAGEAAEAAPADADLGGAFDDEQRELCPDGACIGIIGANGRCKVCGTKRSGT